MSESEFTEFIFPHLSMPKRGPKCKLGYHRLFNLILWVLYTGMPWKCLPVPKDAHGQPAIHYTNVYKPLPHGLMMGRSSRRSSPVWGISQTRRDSMYACCTVTGPTPWPKKGTWHSLSGYKHQQGEKVIAITDNHGYVLSPLPVAPSMRPTWSCCPRV